MAIVKCKKANMRDLMLKLNDLLEDARLRQHFGRLFCQINSYKIPEQENVSIMLERLGNIRIITDSSAYQGKKLRFV